MSFWAYLERNYDRLLSLGLEHLVLVLQALALGTVLGVGIGVLVARRPVARSIALNTTGLILTIPSFALFSLLFGAIGKLGTAVVLPGLVLYSLLPIIRNTVTGLLAVDPAIVEAAKGVGMGPRRRLVRIELPLAWPVVLTGVRVSAVLLVGIAALGALVRGPGLGELIFSGLRLIGSPNAQNLALAGTLGVVVIAVLLDAMFLLLSRLTTSKGLR
ncbi:MAG TPA: ABC transporter permease [Mycobacteriales bacterium]|nr:ABC transporter permease [Mycobacteriales bacterium]